LLLEGLCYHFVTEQMKVLRKLPEGGFRLDVHALLCKMPKVLVRFHARR
jgi:hypothetical protein